MSMSMEAGSRRVSGCRTRRDLTAGDAEDLTGQWRQRLPQPAGAGNAEHEHRLAIVVVLWQGAEVNVAGRERRRLAPAKAKPFAQLVELAPQFHQDFGSVKGH